MQFSIYTSGNVYNGENVTAVFREQGWIFIEYTVDSTRKLKRGYVNSNSISVQENIVTFTPERKVRYVNSNVNTLWGPNPTTYEVAGSVSRGESVHYLGRKENNNAYAFIEYSVGNQRKRAYIKASYLSVDVVSEYENYKVNDTIPNGYPMAGAIVTQGFNDKGTNLKGHFGYDMAGFTYATPLFEGKVVSVQTSTSPANGRAVCIRHSINNVTFYSTYCHLASVLVSVGNTVTTSTQLGMIGGSGYGSENYYGTHLHVCTYTGTATTNPMGYCGGGTYTFEEQSEYANACYYGPDSAMFPNCGGVCFYDPYSVVSSNATIIKSHHP